MRFVEQIYRPPAEAHSLLVQVMQSCTWNKCNFCYRLKDYPILIATPEEVREQLKSQKPFYPPDPKIFFVGSNSFAIPAKTLNEFISICREEIPHFKKLSMFSRIDAIEHKTDDELCALKTAGLTQLYVGTENGNLEALKLMNKGHTPEEAITQLHRLDRAGIAYVLFYIIGMGGKGTGQKTGKDTAEFFNKVSPRRIASTGMTVTEGTGAWSMRERGEYQDASEREKIEELKTFLDNLRVPTIFDSLHYLNPLHFRLDTSKPEEMAEARAVIDKILAEYSDDALEQAINRRQMEENSKPQR